MRYDTLVLQTIWARIANNAYGGIHPNYSGGCVSSLYSFINHACEPNAGVGDPNVTGQLDLSVVRESSTGVVKKGNYEG